MGLLGKLFGVNKDRHDSAPPPSELDEDESETTTSLSPRNAPRRELVQVVLRDTMRRHGIPSDWIECRILSVVSSTRGTGMHVLLMVRQGDDRLATYVHAFQASFMQELLKFEPKATDWMFSLSWQFDNKPTPSHEAMPEPASWQSAAAASAAAARDLADSPDTVTPEEDELQEDLKALFAIRDAALQEPAAASERADFQDTQPGPTDTDPARGR